MTHIKANAPVIAIPKIIAITTQAGLNTEIQKYTKKKILEPQILQVDQGLTVDGFTIDKPISGARDYLLIRGDQNNWAGYTYAHGETIRTSKSNCGSGDITLSISSNVITVTGSTGNPNFSGLTSNHKILLTSKNGNPSGPIQQHSVVSGSGNTITFSGTYAGALDGVGGAICIVPDRKITRSGLETIKLLAPCGLKIQGFEINYGGYYAVILAIGEPNIDVGIENCTIRSTSNKWGLQVATGANARVESDVTFIGTRGVGVHDQASCYAPNGLNFMQVSTYEIGAYFSANFHCPNILSVWHGDENHLIMCAHGSLVRANNLVALKAEYGVRAEYGSAVYMKYSYLGYISSSGGGALEIQENSTCYAQSVEIDGAGSSGAHGVGCSNNSFADVTDSTIKNISTGCHAWDSSRIEAGNTSSNMSGITTKYSPAASGVEGNKSSYVEWS